MTYQQAYDQAIKMNQVQAAKVFKKLMKAELAPLEDMCQALVPHPRATAQDYAHLDAFVQDAWFKETSFSSSPALAQDDWGTAL